MKTRKKLAKAQLPTADEIIEAVEKKPVAKKPSKKTPAKPLGNSAPFIPGFPKSEGPPSIKNYEGKKALSEHGEVLLGAMDEGAFRWLWETVESKALRDYMTYDASNPAISEAAQRALREIRSSGKAMIRDVEQGRRRKVKRGK